MDRMILGSTGLIRLVSDAATSPFRQPTQKYIQHPDICHTIPLAFKGLIPLFRRACDSHYVSLPSSKLPR
jgi:hypothetical protein